MAEHLGGKSLGAPDVWQANSAGKIKFDGLTIDGEVHGFDLVISGTLKDNAGVGFAFSNPQGVNKQKRGGDDLDAVLDFVFANATLKVDETRELFDAELMSRVRAVVSGLTGRDAVATGMAVDAAALPAGAAQAFEIRQPLPLSLRDELFPEDGDAYKQGSAVVRRGGFYFKAGSINGVVALKNGNGLLAGVVIEIVPSVDAEGDAFYIGPTWKMETNAFPGSEVKLNDLPLGKRLFLYADDPTKGPWTMHGEVETDQLASKYFQDNFNANRRVQGGDNTAAKVLPLIFPRKQPKLGERDFTPKRVYVKDTAGNAITLISVYHKSVDDSVSARVQGEAVQANKGQSVAKVIPTPPSAIGSTSLHPRVQPILGHGFTPAK